MSDLMTRLRSSSPESVGDWAQVGLPILAAGGIVANRDWKGGIQFAKSGALTGLLVFGGKNLVDKWRPNASNPKSFPSGHTAMAFFGASYIYTRYGAKWGMPAAMLLATVMRSGATSQCSMANILPVRPMPL